MAEQRLTFTFHTCLGKGGFGEVYLATLNRPGGLEKRVAVKVLKEDLRNAPEAVKRLRDEGRMLAILDHPCIVRVIEMTLIRGRVALVTEYLDGVDLARCCRPPRLLPPKVVVGALGEVASALHCAWTTISPETGKPLELIHRDVKPENIRIGRHGEVKLLDFGIARTTEMFRHAKTAMGDLPFTPGYAAPEAFTKGFQGSASDVYALGVTLYRLLVGERLYEDMELSDQVTICCLPERYAPFLRQRLARIEAPESVQALVRDMLAYEATARPSAAEVERRCAEIADALEGPTLVRWARATELPEPIGLPDGTLTGETITEDRIKDQRPTKPRGVRLKPKSGRTPRLLDLPDDSPPPPRAPGNRPSAVTDITPPPAAPPLTPPPPTPVPGGSRAYTPELPPRVPAVTQSLPAPTPPPPPTDLVGVKPVTGPVGSALKEAREAVRSVAAPDLTPWDEPSEEVDEDDGSPEPSPEPDSALWSPHATLDAFVVPSISETLGPPPVEAPLVSLGTPPGAPRRATPAPAPVVARPPASGSVVSVVVVTAVVFGLLGVASGAAALLVVGAAWLFL